MKSGDLRSEREKAKISRRKIQSPFCFQGPRKKQDSRFNESVNEYPSSWGGTICGFSLLGGVWHKE